MAGKCLFASGRWEGGFSNGMHHILETWTYRCHPTSLYLTVVSTLGNAYNTVGYSFPLLPPALQGGLQCGWGGDMTIPSTFTLVKFTLRQLPFFGPSHRELKRCLVFCGGFRVAKNTRRQAWRCPFLLNRGGDAHRGRKGWHKKTTGFDKWRCNFEATKIYHSFTCLAWLLVQFSITPLQLHLQLLQKLHFYY